MIYEQDLHIGWSSQPGKEIDQVTTFKSPTRDAFYSAQIC